MVTAVGRAINHRPRADRGGRTRAGLLGVEPTDGDIERARQALAERLRKQEKARETLAARQDPVARATIAHALVHLGLADPDGHFLTAIARYPLAAIVEGVAIYEGKHNAGTLPPTADARYLLGIVRNRANLLEAHEIASAIWEARVAARDRLAKHWQTRLDHLRARHHDIGSLLDAAIAAAVATSFGLERHFWIRAAADAVLSQPDDTHHTLYDRAVRHIRSHFACPQRVRIAMLATLAGLIRPVA